MTSASLMEAVRLLLAVMWHIEVVMEGWEQCCQGWVVWELVQIVVGDVGAGSVRLLSR